MEFKQLIRIRKDLEARLYDLNRQIADLDSLETREVIPTDIVYEGLLDLVMQGKISINDGRKVLGLKPLDTCQLSTYIEPINENKGTRR